MLDADERALLDAIRAAPDDDGPRLVLADALARRGDPWGELIVVSCAIDRLRRAALVASGGYQLSEQPGLWRAEDAGELATLQRRNWELVRQIVPNEQLAPHVERGFCAKLFVRDAAALADAAGPFYTLSHELELHDAQWRSIARLRDWPLLSQIARLQLQGLDLAAARELLAVLGSAVALRELELHRCSSMDLLRALFELPHAHQLRRLELSACNVADVSGIEWPQLDTLVLRDARLDDGAVGRLLESNALHGLVRLDLSDNRLYNAAARAIARAPFRRLAVLELGHTRIGDRGAGELALAHTLRGLECLRLGNADEAEIDESLPWIAHAFHELVELDLEVPACSETNLATFARTLRTPLRCLRLRRAAITAPVMRALVGNPALRGVRVLELKYGPIPDDAMAILAEAELPQLEWLDVNGCSLSVAAGRMLASAPHLPASLWVRIRNNGLEDLRAELDARFESVDL